MLRKCTLLARTLPAALLAGLSMFALPAVHARQAQASLGQSEPDKAAKPAKSQLPELVTIHIELTAGEKTTPGEGASIYVRYNEPHRIKADKLVEMNVKTSAEGKVRVPLVPKGKILIQVVAEGWKTYGRWFDLTEDGQVFKIHLDRPHKWY